MRKETAEKERMREDADKHLEIACSLCKIQLKGEREFLHKHPAGASSWDVGASGRGLEEGSETTIADQCMYGIMTWSTNKKLVDTSVARKHKILQIANPSPSSCRGNARAGKTINS